jgi:hypothetical protein
MRAGSEERQSFLFRIGYGSLFLVIGAGLLVRAYAMGAPESVTAFDLMACGATGLCFVVAGIALLTHDPQDDACVQATPSPEGGAARAPYSTSPSGPPRGTARFPCRAADGLRYRDVARTPRPRRALPRRSPAHP